MNFKQIYNCGLCVSYKKILNIYNIFHILLLEQYLSQKNRYIKMQCKRYKKTMQIYYVMKIYFN